MMFLCDRSLSFCEELRDMEVAGLLGVLAYHFFVKMLIWVSDPFLGYVIVLFSFH
jgi:hypothetical protein